VQPNRGPLAPLARRTWQVALASLVTLSGALAGAVVVQAPVQAAEALPTVPAQPRIMPLGDSITAGVGSSAGTGWRDDLAVLLSDAGVVADFVGSQSTPGQPGLEHEGHGGWRIDQIDTHVVGWMAATTPDVVMLNIGSNDYVRRFSTGTAPARLSTLISNILDASPNVRIVVSKLLVPTGTTRAAGVRTYNTLMAGIVASKGPRVTLVDMSRISNVNTTDGLHPTDLGYRQMAFQWYQGLRRVLTGGAALPVAASPFPVPTVRLTRAAAKLRKGAAAELTVRLGGALTATDLGRVPVQLLYRAAGTSSWSVLQTASTSGTGTVVFKRLLKRSGSFAARVVGGTAAGRQSAAVSVAVQS
jgi:lysophospholipase L1-like esterase